MKLKIIAVLLACFTSFLVGRQSVTTKETVTIIRLRSMLNAEDLGHDQYGPQEVVVPPKEFEENDQRSIELVALPSFAWIKVQVEDSGTHKVGETCSISENGAVTSTKFSHGDSILVFYHAPKDERYGARCDDSTFFLMSRTVFDRLKQNTLPRNF